jgi:endogenous inhibitor of DNA gyrase (YacG/DUF329 family)
MNKIKRIAIVCEQCHKVFYDIASNRRRFCSHKCKVNSQRVVSPVTCDICGKVFYKIPSKAKKSKFCSLKCQGIRRSQKAIKVKKICTVCGTVFKVWPSAKETKYCCLKCKYADQPNITNTGKFKKGQTAWNAGLNHNISDLVKKWTGVNNGRWLGGLSTTPYPSEFNDTLKNKIRKRDNYTCRECHQTKAQLGYTLAVHHIDYNKNNNDPVNLISLCKSCHAQTNFKRSDWTEYFKNIKQ